MVKGKWQIRIFKIPLPFTPCLLPNCYVCPKRRTNKSTATKGFSDNDDLERKQSLLTASLSFENEFRDTQKRLTIFSQLVSKQENLASTLEKITRYLPQDLFLKTVNFSDNSFQIDGISPNETNIQQYIVNLQSTGSFSDIGIREIKSDPKDPNILKFSFIAQLK